jgi:non-specific serine/threonine protein kinase
LEVEELRHRLTMTRLLTIVGVGGAGKSRLALELAWGFVGQYSDGVWLIELAPLFDGALVPQYVASVFGLLDMPGQVASHTLAAALRTRRLLLVLDNCEHVLTACAGLVETLLEACPHVHILATSRTILGLVGENVWRVPSLSLPDEGRRVGAGELAQSEAGRLFVERARAIAPDFVATEQNADAIAKVCLRLDGIPLALELAAARVRTLGIADLAARLDDRFRLLTGGHPSRPARQRTLRAAVDWSYELLSTTEREVFSRLCVFNGGCTLEAAEAVCSVSTPDAQNGWERLPVDSVLDVLEQLVDKSLVIAEPRPDGSMRYRLLETLRQYAEERLESTGKADEVRTRHADYFCEVLPRWWQPNWWGPHLANRLKCVEEELENFRAALRWLVAAGRLEPALRLGYAMGPFWFTTARVSEGRSQLAPLIAALPRDAEPSAARAGVLAWFGGFAIQDGAYPAGRKALEQALIVARASGDDLALAYALVWLAVCCEWGGLEPGLARNYAEEGAKVSRVSGYPALEAMGLRVLAQIALDAGDLHEAWRLAVQGLTAGREAEHPLSIAWALHALGLVRFRQREFESARSLFEDSLNHGRGMVAAPIRLATHVCVAWVFIEQGDLAQASARAIEALDMARSLLPGPVFLALPLEAITQIAAAANQPDRALRLAGAAAALRHDTWLRMSVRDDQLERWVRRARAAIGEAAANAAWVGGQALDEDEAVADAVSLLTVVADSRSTSVEGPDDRKGPDGIAGSLTSREVEVAMLIARGFSNRQIAEALVIALPTAERHVANILHKLQLASRTQVAVWATRHGAPEQPSPKGNAARWSGHE